MGVQDTALEEHASRAAEPRLWVQNPGSLKRPLHPTPRKINHHWVVLCACMHVLLYQWLSADVSIRGKFQKCSIPGASSSAVENTGF